MSSDKLPHDGRLTLGLPLTHCRWCNRLLVEIRGGFLCECHDLCLVPEKKKA